ncbi:hypothetical protein KO566_10315 [Flavobacteriaceae bacterium XHP0103]|uniref:hypothetical protein n=1 Tax=Marixanthotalea marina TaxID=2844359 RepID=UPI002989D683|nr:hypothetical protein [Marixanthotalea marina]MBU3822456.1 hypothetical protein [Marixanthotalea marina]
METSQLKIVSISGKGLKKRLLVSSREVATLYSFLKDLVEGDLMIINTNIGLDVYYHSPVVYDDLIVNAFLLLSTCKGEISEDFYVKSLNTHKDIESETVKLFEKLVKNPLLFKSYSKSLFNQLKMNYSYSPMLIDELLALWRQKIYEMDFDNKIMSLIPQMAHLQGESSDASNQLLLKHLINETLRTARSN